MSTRSKNKKLSNAARDGKFDDVRRWCLENEETVDVNGKDNHGWTALHWASRSGHYDIVELLLTHGAEINAVTNRNTTPLMMACANGNSSITKLLLDRGFNANAVNDHGNTALHCACWNGHDECVKDLLTKGADTTIQNDKGNTPQMYLKMYLKKKYQAILEILTLDMKKSKEDDAKADDPTT